MDNRIGDFLKRQRTAFAQKPMTHSEVLDLISDLFPPWVLSMDRTPPSTSDAVLGAESAQATWKDAASGASSGGILEWAQSVDSANKRFRVVSGPVMWSSVCVNTATPVLPLDDQYVSYSGVSDGDVRYLFVEIILSTTPDAANASVKLGENLYYPVCEPNNMIVRWPLSLWLFTVNGSDITLVRQEPTAWAGGHIPTITPSSIGPPLAE